MTTTMTEQFAPAVERLSTQLEQELGQIEINVLTNYTLADAIREGSTVSRQEYDWGSGDSACALSAAAISAAARGYVK